MLSRPTGVSYPLWFRENVVASTLSAPKTAAAFGISAGSVHRFRALHRAGQLEGGRKPRDVDSRNLTLTPDDIEGLMIFVNISPQATLRELQSYLLHGHHVQVSTSTVCRELKRCGMSRKKLKRFSLLRDEEERIKWWTSPPHENGVAGLDVDSIIDIDESTFTWDSAQRKHGYSVIGSKASCPGLVRLFLFHNETE